MLKFKYIFPALLMLFACNDGNDSLADYVQTERMTDDNTIEECYFEDFSHLKNAKQFNDILETQESFNDTIWTDEGKNKVYVTKTKGCPAITAYWKNADFSDLIKIDAIDHVMNDKNPEDYIYCGGLKSKTNVEMHMNLKDLVELNGDEIKFKLFGSEESGKITSYGNGMLKDEKLTIYVDFRNAREGNFNYPQMSDSDSEFSTKDSELDLKDLIVVKFEKNYNPLK